MGKSYSWGDSVSPQEEHFFAVRTISHGNDLPQEAVDSLTLGTFKIQMSKVLGPSCLNSAFDKKGWIVQPDILWFYDSMTFTRSR